MEKTDKELAEEMLDKHFEHLQSIYPNLLQKDVIIETLQDYAEEYYKAKLKDELIKFADYTFKKALRIDYSQGGLTIYVDEYLKQRK